MAYSELVKSFDRIRSYMREFYIYGFRTREEFSEKSGRSYDNERRRLESILGDFTASARVRAGKNVYLSIDSRGVAENPLYRLLRSCSFTDKDITLHFMLFDILYSDEELSLSEIMERIEKRTAEFECPMQFDESGVRKKLDEYCRLSMLQKIKSGRAVCYRRSSDIDLLEYVDAISFFSETGMCGALGSFICDKYDVRSPFAYKHHYITHALDSVVMCGVFEAISQKRTAALVYRSSAGDAVFHAVPLKIFASVQNGRQWLMAYDEHKKIIRTYRIDNIRSVTLGDLCSKFDEYISRLDEIRKSMWGVASSLDGTTKTVRFSIRIGENEEHIYRRLLREKRCGRVERIDEHTAVFTAEVQDVCEMIPWIRTFIGRIIQLDFSDRTTENRLRSDIEEMYLIYGIGGESDVP